MNQVLAPRAVEPPPPPAAHPVVAPFLGIKVIDMALAAMGLV